MHTETRWSDITNNFTTQLAVHVEASTRCNSRCPLCPRFIAFTPHTDPKLRLGEININEFKNWFPPEVLGHNSFHFNFCGNYGDPTACVDLAEIVEYLAENDVPRIFVRTNGGARNAKFWTKMGSILNSEDRHVVWSVDGMEDTNELYRREVKWNTLQRNIKAFNDAGGYSKQEFLVFKHNQHQKDQARRHALKVGIKEINFKAALGFTNEHTKQYMPKPALNKYGKVTHILEAADEYKMEGYTDLDTPIEHMIRKWEIQGENCVKDLDHARPIDMYRANLEKILEKNKSLENTTIKCQAHFKSYWTEYREVFLNPNGDVAPCCFFGQITNEHHPTEDILTRDNLKPFKELNLNNNSIGNILKILDNKVADKWNKSHKEGRSLTCSRTCGVREDNSFAKANLYREKETIKRPF